MKQVHYKEKEQFKKLFDQEKVELIDDRLRVLDAFLQTEKHITIDELSEILIQSGYCFDYQFIKDTLKLMCRFGFAQKIRFGDGQVRYEHRHLGQHHDHMICTKCSKIIEFEDDQIENFQVQVASMYGFHMLQHKMEIYGICSDCLKEQAKLIPLTLAKPGERLVIKDFSGGANIRLRLLTIGLRIGDNIEVVTNPNTGQIIVSLDFKRYAIGRGMAQKVLVEREGEKRKD
jgi:Fur family ferric uptake transcriptional regulator